MKKQDYHKGMILVVIFLMLFLPARHVGCLDTGWSKQERRVQIGLPIRHNGIAPNANYHCVCKLLAIAFKGFIRLYRDWVNVFCFFFFGLKLMILSWLGQEKFAPQAVWMYCAWTKLTEEWQRQQTHNLPGDDNLHKFNHLKIKQQK